MKFSYAEYLSVSQFPYLHLFVVYAIVSVWGIVWGIACFSENKKGLLWMQPLNFIVVRPAGIEPATFSSGG